MFDPTVFDNLKVITEGYIYDLDMENKIVITDRSDIIDLAIMSRRYTVTFALNENKPQSAMIRIEMNHNQIAGELLHKIKKTGCNLKVTFQEEVQIQGYDELLLKKLHKTWEGNVIKLFVTKEMTSNMGLFHNCYQVEFLSVYGEDQIEDLLHIVDDTISLLRIMTKN